jgi:hypothetical protein
LGGNLVGSVQRLAVAPSGALFAASLDVDAPDGPWVYVWRFDGRSWQRVAGGINPSAGPNSVISLFGLVADQLGQPLVLVASSPDGATTPYAHQVFRFSNVAGAWQAVGGAILTLGRGTPVGFGQGALALDPADNIVVAYTRPFVASGFAIQVVRWDGANWSPVSGASRVNNSDATDPCLAIGPDGVPVIAYRQTAAGALAAFVESWTPGGFQLLPGDGPSGGLAGSPLLTPGIGVPKLTVDRDKRPILVFFQKESTGYGHLFVYRYEQGRFTQLGGTSSITDVNFEYEVAADSLGRPVAVVHDSAAMPNASVLRWESSSWTLLGDEQVLRATDGETPLAIESHDRPLVAVGGKVLRSNQ